MRHPFYFLLIIVFLSSCSSKNKDKEQNKQQSSMQKMEEKAESNPRTIIDAGARTPAIGKPGRIIVVCDNTIYTEEIQALFDSVFSQPIRPYYPATYFFKVYQKTMKQFKEISPNLRNIIDLKLDTTIPKGHSYMRIYKNYYAKGQLYTKIRTNNINDLYAVLKKQIDYLFRIYKKQGWVRQYHKMMSIRALGVDKKINKKFGIDLVLPRSVRYESIDDTYAIMRFPDRSRQMDLKTYGSTHSAVTNFVVSGIMVWQYPFRDSSQLEPKNLLEMRDTILKKYAKYNVEGVYMGTQYFGPVAPVSKVIKINGIKGIQFRGLYKFTGKYEPSGGRFWGFQFKNPKTNKIVAISGYLGAPPTMSVNYDINRIRAVLYSLQLEK